MRQIEVKAGGSSYEVYVGPGLLAQAGLLLSEAGFGDRAVIITNPVVKDLCGDALEQSLAGEGFQVTMLEVPDGEKQKSLRTAGWLYQKLSDFYAERTTPILALGGGVIGDLSGFVAATYLRGVPFIQVPTTLLAQVDSSIGGKVAVNHGRLKNRIGAFYQPHLVISDVNTLGTLSIREFTNGLAEIIKVAFIRDRRFFAYLEENLDRIRSLDSEVLEEIISKSVEIKAEIVEKDERDLGLRNILNYGHTIGHAVETASGFEVKHGEAVAIGMLAAGRISNKMGLLPESELARLERVIERAGLPTEMSGLRPEKMIEAMRHDKKVLEGKIRFVLPRLIGDVFISDGVNLSLIEQVLAG
ncbi:MAG: 3-dehydroquinate synthase [Chloroflexota bacterium]|nr:3-dehydroquinate synthase [Chloroflexota bacterium]